MKLEQKAWTEAATELVARTDKSSSKLVARTDEGNTDGGSNGTGTEGTDRGSNGTGTKKQ